MNHVNLARLKIDQIKPINAVLGLMGSEYLGVIPFETDCITCAAGTEKELELPASEAFWV